LLGCLMRTPQMRVRTVALLLILILSAFSFPQAVFADDDRLNTEEKAYVARVDGALKSATVVALDVLDIAEGDLIDSIFIEERAGTGDLTAILDQADRALAQAAAVLLETPPFSMTTLQGTYAGTAELFEAGYGGCTAIAVKEGHNAALEWGKDVLASMYGMGGGDGGGDGVALASRIKNCIVGRSTAIVDAASTARQLLGSKTREVQENREPDIDVVTPGGGLIECFIATAAYGSPEAEQIDVLRDFRDEVLAKSEAGRDYIGFYYAVSPSIAAFMVDHEWLRTLVREMVVDPIVYATEATRPLWSCS